jgi:hypothetical protein
LNRSSRLSRSTVHAVETLFFKHNDEEVSMRIQFKKITLVTALFVIFTIMTGHGVFADEAQVIFGVG